MTTAYAAIANETGTTVPPHLQAQAEIPIVPAGKIGRQGDVYIGPTTITDRQGHPIPIDGGHKVVQGDADRNSHILIGDGTFTPGVIKDRVLDYGLLEVPEGGTAYIVHTSEHGAIGFGEGTYRVWGQKSFEQEIRRAAD